VDEIIIASINIIIYSASGGPPHDPVDDLLERELPGIRRFVLIAEIERQILPGDRGNMRTESAADVLNTCIFSKQIFPDYEIDVYVR
jgi:hypothetical protein